MDAWNFAPEQSSPLYGPSCLQHYTQPRWKPNWVETILVQSWGNFLNISELQTLPFYFLSMHKIGCNKALTLPDSSLNDIWREKYSQKWSKNKLTLKQNSRKMLIRTISSIVQFLCEEYFRVEPTVAPAFSRAPVCKISNKITMLENSNRENLRTQWHQKMDIFFTVLCRSVYGLAPHFENGNCVQ